MKCCPMAGVMFRDKISSEHGPLHQVVDHYRGLFLAEMTSQSAVDTFGQPDCCGNGSVFRRAFWDPCFLLLPRLAMYPKEV